MQNSSLYTSSYQFTKWWMWGQYELLIIFSQKTKKKIYRPLFKERFIQIFKNFLSWDLSEWKMDFSNTYVKYYTWNSTQLDLLKKYMALGQTAH